MRTGSHAILLSGGMFFTDGGCATPAPVYLPLLRFSVPALTITAADGSTQKEHFSTQANSAVRTEAYLLLLFVTTAACKTSM